MLEHKATGQKLYSRAAEIRKGIWQLGFYFMGYEQMVKKPFKILELIISFKKLLRSFYLFIIPHGTCPIAIRLNSKPTPKMEPHWQSSPSLKLRRNLAEALTKADPWCLYLPCLVRYAEILSDNFGILGGVIRRHIAQWLCPQANIAPKQKHFSYSHTGKDQGLLRRRIRGQTVLEYSLLLVVIAGIMLTFFANNCQPLKDIFNGTFIKMQGRIVNGN